MEGRTLTGKFVKSVEVVPEKGIGIDDLRIVSGLLSGVVDMATVPENPMGRPGIDPVSALLEITRGTSIEPVPHITPRDKNSLYIRSQVLTAMKFGIRRFFVIGGDRISPQVQSKEVRELDVFQTIDLIKSTAAGTGEEVEVGSAFNPYRENESKFAMKKIDSGSSFFITQVLTSAEPLINGGFTRENAFLIAGFMPMKKRSSVSMLEKMGVRIKGTRFERIADSEDPLGESTRVILETVDEIRGLISGVHIMPMGDYDTATKILECI